MALIGKLATITDRTSPYCGMCGIIRGFDGERYLVRMSGGKAEFSRGQFEV